MSTDAVRQQLEKILASDHFVRSPRLSRFLRFIVEQTIGGHGDTLKEYVIGIDVFDKSPSYDQRLDPIVRVQARALRARLKAYYGAVGRDDSVVIECRSGAYVPSFKVKQPRDSGRVRTKRTAIAVLPFADLSEQKTQRFFCDGITDELINALAAVTGLHVVARTSVFRYREQPQDIRDIGRLLKVRTILEGSVRRMGDRLRIAARLVNVTNGFPLWSATYERRAGDVFAIQESIARSIVKILKIRFVGHDKPKIVRHYTESAQVYASYLKGLFYLNKQTRDGLTRSIRCFSQGLRKEPLYAPAHAGLAHAYCIQGFNGFRAPRIVMPRAKTAASRAIEIDAGLSEAHHALGVAKAAYYWDWRGSGDAFRMALRLNPGSSTAYRVYAMMCLVPRGALKEAFDALRHALTLDPLSIMTSHSLALTLYMDRRFDAAIRQARRTLELDPASVPAHLVVGLASMESARHRDAIDAFRVVADRSADDPYLIGALGHCLGAAGKASEARKVLAKLFAISKERYVPALDIARIHIGLRDHDRAFAWLDKSCDERCSRLIWLNVHPMFDSLRADPRFARLQGKLGLAT